MNRGKAESTFRSLGHVLVPMANRSPGQDSQLERVLLRNPNFSSGRLNLGNWQSSNKLLTQYKWQDGTIILHSLIAQIRLLQVHHQAGPHGALSKWERQLGCSVLDEIWATMWLTYRSAADNTFLWQLLYRIPAINVWRFPDRPVNDPATRCQRWTLHTPEDVYHCIWACDASRGCWEWCNAWILPQHSRNVRHSPAHALVAEALPLQWEIPVRLWHTMRAVICWVIWKERNSHVFNGEISNSHRMIGQSWSQIGMYDKAAWHDLLTKVRAHELTLPEATDRMADQFGNPGKIWSLHNIQLQVSQVPPRPS